MAEGNGNNGEFSKVPLTVQRADVGHIDWYVPAELEAKLRELSEKEPLNPARDVALAYLAQMARLLGEVIMHDPHPPHMFTQIRTALGQLADETEGRRRLRQLH